MNDSFDDFFLFAGIVWYNISVSVDINQLTRRTYILNFSMLKKILPRNKFIIIYIKS